MNEEIKSLITLQEIGISNYSIRVGRESVMEFRGLNSAQFALNKVYQDIDTLSNHRKIMLARFEKDSVFSVHSFDEIRIFSFPHDSDLRVNQRISLVLSSYPDMEPVSGIINPLTTLDYEIDINTLLIDFEDELSERQGRVDYEGEEQRIKDLIMGFGQLEYIKESTTDKATWTYMDMKNEGRRSGVKIYFDDNRSNK